VINNDFRGRYQDVSWAEMVPFGIGIPSSTSSAAGYDSLIGIGTWICAGLLRSGYSHSTVTLTTPATAITQQRPQTTKDA